MNGIDPMAARHGIAGRPDRHDDPTERNLLVDDLEDLFEAMGTRIRSGRRIDAAHRRSACRPTSGLDHDGDALPRVLPDLVNGQVGHGDTALGPVLSADQLL